ncbi:hypothetical protein K7862_22465 [Streptomyces sp. PLK6-54]|uniref:Uncharacterized protein n=1 Tax=Actinacidiphila acidipaludis TaxID=2873382 RepID=A0ABS7QB62_9ACTN|nr:hypothetical protein [Streptomyces acidipaludis]MBY8880378.1 hypothetical protein [Streptomyces acidipaludis]
MFTRQQPARTGTRQQNAVQTRLPWWAVALPAIAFATLLALIAGGPASADASGAAPGADTFGRIAAAIGGLLHHLL